MKLLVVTHVIHRNKNDQIGGYAPYVREMNLWFRHVDSVRVVAPIENGEFGAIDFAYNHPDLRFVEVPKFDLLCWRSFFRTLFVAPFIVLKIIVGMFWANHIHIRCPGNMGLLGCFVQVFFPFKSKTAKYAGNWDRHSKQPLSFRLQRWLLNNPWLTRNMRVLVYGDWPGSSRNIYPFFTASYSSLELEQVDIRQLEGVIRIIFVGTLSKGKQPLLAVQAVKDLSASGVAVMLDIYGDGTERTNLEYFIEENRLSEIVRLHGNVSSEIIKSAFKSAHFLIFPSKSEGWPKAVAEAMFWGCVPVTTRVSCVPYMLANGARGALVDSSVSAIVDAINKYLACKDFYTETARAAMEWSRQFTLERFESEIGRLLNSGVRGG